MCPKQARLTGFSKANSSHRKYRCHNWGSAWSRKLDVSRRRLTGRGGIAKNHTVTKRTFADPGRRGTLFAVLDVRRADRLAQAGQRAVLRHADGSGGRADGVGGLLGGQA